MPLTAAGTSAAGATAAAASGEDQLRIEMLGAGNEVGRSCCVLTFKGEWRKDVQLSKYEVVRKADPAEGSTNLLCPISSGRQDGRVRCRRTPCIYRHCSSALH